ncbi:MAG: response regulator [Sphingobacteriaceae bacterium]|nr:MAG: response regulator [Sphingobacteriaceae bacterium]
MKAKRIVVIDNDPAVLDVIQQTLHYEGFNVEIFEGTDDIISLIQQCQPDLVILDYILDGVNGGELCGELKSHRSTAKLPVLICSAYPRVLQSLGFYGCDAFLAKPFGLTELVSKVSGLLMPKSDMEIAC